MIKKNVIADFKSPFKEALDKLPEKTQRIIREKVEFIKINHRRGKRIKALFPEDFREHHAGRYRIFYIVEESNNEIKLSFLYIEIRKDSDKTYGKKTLSRLRTIAR